MAYALYRGTRLGLALQDALAELEEYEQISPSVKMAVLRKFDETICHKLEHEVDTSITVKADRLWSFRSDKFGKQTVLFYCYVQILWLSLAAFAKKCGIFKLLRPAYR